MLRMIFLVFLCLPMAAWPAETRVLIDKQALEEFIDGVVAGSRANRKVAGAVVAFLQGDDLLLAKGYGYSDVELKIPVDPENTLFRIASVSKLFTYTAMLQLHEQGKLDLEANIQDYLPRLKIPAMFGETIRVKHLFTHTAGFGDRIFGLFSNDASVMLPYADILEEELPERQRLPGTLSSYSNHSVGIAGLIIENVSGQSWPDYIQEHILTPLKMSNSTAQQPIPKPLLGQMSKTYEWRSGKYVSKPFEFVSLASAGGMSASGLDMVKFLRFHLSRGTVEGAQILSETAIDRMHSPLFSTHSALNPMAYGLIHGNANNVHSVGHGGATMAFMTEFIIFPQHDLGLFVSANTAGGQKLAQDIKQAFLDRYFPYVQAKPQVITSPSDLDEIVGEYVSYRHPYDSILKLYRQANSVSVTSDRPGQIRYAFAGGDPKQAVETSPLVFQILGEAERIVFDTDVNGKRRMFIGSTLASRYKLSGFEKSSAQQLMVVFWGLVFIWILIAWPIQQFTASKVLSEVERRARRWYFLLGASLFVMLVGLSMTVGMEVVFGMSQGLRWVLLFVNIIPLLACVAMFGTLRISRDSSVSSATRAFHCVAATATLVLCWQLYYWNFFGGW